MPVAPRPPSPPPARTVTQLTTSAHALVGHVRPSAEPSADPYAHFFSPGRRSRRLSTAAVVLGAVTVVGAVGWIWSTSGPSRSSGATPEFGTFVLSSHPPGALVAVDGVPAGATPLALRLAAGSHSIVATASNGRSERLSATVAAGESASRHLMLESPEASAGAGDDERRETISAQTPPPASSAAAPAVAPSPGFVTFTAPFDLRIFEGGNLLGAAGERIRVRPGAHTFTLVNDQLGFRNEQAVVVGAGRSLRRVIEQSSAPLNINATPWAEVVIGGRSVGETPLANISLPIGSHKVTLRHPTLGEREVEVTVGLDRPNRLVVDLRR